ncbi:MAG: hypothetical protein AB1513_02135 [Pseudomonadota bacterium]
MFSFANWSVLTVDFLIVLYLMLGGVTFISILHLSNAKWRYEVRTLAVSLFGLYPVAFVLLVILLAAGKMTFPWLDAAEGHGEHHLPGWHNYTFFVVRQVAFLSFVGWLFSRFIKLQAVSEQSAEDWERFKRTALLIPFAYVLYGTMVAWDFEMTMQPSWHSAIYGMYHFVSNFGMFLAFTVTLIYFLSRNGKLVKPMPDYIYNYFAQLLLAFTILWTYTFFAQYLTIWYGNLPYERDRIVGMEGGAYAGLWWTFFTLKFIVPFVLLVFPYTRHTPSLIVKIAFSIMIGTWIERYTWISGSYGNTHLPMTGLFDIVVTVLVLASAYVMVKRSLARNNVIRA